MIKVGWQEWPGKEEEQAFLPSYPHTVAEKAEGQRDDIG